MKTTGIPGVKGMECDGSSVSLNTSDGYVCACLNVTHADLLAAMARHDVRTLEDLCRYTGAGDGCMACRPRLPRYLNAAAHADSCGARAVGSPMTTSNESDTGACLS